MGQGPQSCSRSAAIAGRQRGTRSTVAPGGAGPWAGAHAYKAGLARMYAAYPSSEALLATAVCQCAGGQ